MNAAQMLPDLKRISCSGSFLSDFVEQCPDECHVIDIQTKKFLITNHHHVSHCGLRTIEDFVGLAKEEVLEAMQQKENLSPITLSNHIKNIKLSNRAEDQIRIQKRPISNKHPTIRKNGTIKFEHSFKCGVLNQDHKVIAIFSVFLDLTHQIPLRRIFSLYQEFYSEKAAIQKFLEHFNIAGFFEPLSPLTFKEVQVLISMRDNSRYKAIANALGMSVATASNHISHIRDKLKCGVLHDVLSKLPTIPESQQSMYVYV